MKRNDRASVTPMVVAVLAVLSALTIGVSRLGSVAVTRARADAVADLVALGAATGGPVAAERVATANSSVLTDMYLRSDGASVVAIRHRSLTARAAATTAWPGP